jgi:transcriptional regulator GlxA family with amidase domain
VKVTVEVDCTPEEARRFLGLPDVVPMQQAAMEKLQQRMESAVEATTPEAVLKAWMPMTPEQMQRAFAKLFGAFGGLKPGNRG